MIADPSRPHGVWGQALQTVGAEIQFASGIYNVNLAVVALNFIYVFTKVHAQCVAEFFEIMSIKDLREIGLGDDIFLAFSEDQAPLCRDVGPLEFCPSYSQSGVV